MKTVSPEENLRRVELVRAEAIDRFSRPLEAEWLEEQEDQLEAMKAQWEEKWIEDHADEIEAYLAEQEDKWRAGLAVELEDLRLVWEDDWQEANCPGFGEGWTVIGLGGPE